MGWRVWGRERGDYTARYPELEVLRRLPIYRVFREEYLVPTVSPYEMHSSSLRRWDQNTRWTEVEVKSKKGTLVTQTRIASDKN